MPRIRFHGSGGGLSEVEVEAGTSVMRAAIEHGVPGIIGECGGQAMCATCHVYVEEADGLPPIGDDEEEMLECTAAPRDPARSRLGCQLRAGSDFDELDVGVPATQV